MRRLIPIGLVAFALAGCGKAEVVTPTPETVIGTVAQAPTGSDAGKALFTLVWTTRKLWRRRFKPSLLFLTASGRW